ncbi:ROK family protein [Arcticibacter sp. MXS-1]|uniref:ROK family protein n=1 Tax=Arcticibacter sp. MXS-1 TaxID=3341726 RepID=UPI0035A89F98
MDKSYVLGVDIGGSHITSALVDISTGDLLEGTRVRKAVDSHAAPGIVISFWTEAIAQSFSKAGLPIGKIGIAMPGPLDYEEGICWIKDQDKYEHLYGYNIKDLLSASLSIHKTDIRIMNDACCFLQGEVLGTLDKRYSRVMGFTLGTGLGSAFYQEGTVVDADLWRMPFKGSIAEEHLSTRWFLNRYSALKGREIENVKEMLQDELAEMLYAEFGATLGVFLQECLKTYNPQAVVLGGNIAKSPELYLKHTEEVLESSGQLLPISIAGKGRRPLLSAPRASGKRI